MKNNDLKFIKDFGKITVKEACKVSNVLRCNVYRGVASPKKIKAVRVYIEQELVKLMDQTNVESEDNSL